MPSRKVSVDLADLCAAFGECRVDYRYYLDLEAGELIHVSDEFMDYEEREKLDEMVEKGLGERYIAIPEASSEEDYEDMVDFVDRVEDMALKEKLCIALDGSGCFRRFKDVLLGYPKERERWFRFKDAKLRERVKEWLEGEEIEIVRMEAPK